MERRTASENIHLERASLAFSAPQGEEDTQDVGVNNSTTATILSQRREDQFVTRKAHANQPHAAATSSLTAPSDLALTDDDFAGQAAAAANSPFLKSVTEESTDQPTAANSQSAGSASEKPATQPTIPKRKKTPYQPKRAAKVLIEPTSDEQTHQPTTARRKLVPILPKPAESAEARIEEESPKAPRGPQREPVGREESNAYAFLSNFF